MADLGKKPPVAPSYESDLRLEYTAAIIAKRVEAGKLLPLEVLLMTMDGHVEARNMNAACAVAVQAAPYVHPRLKDLTVNGSLTGESSIRLEVGKGLKGLSQKELETLEKLLEKASKE